ncbi:MAG TPA: DUF1549 domain-containing protein [Pirellulaceae bacterium]|nr:DUF1549 domain-containing protein [Pirellulaceae bacterium]
MRSLLGLLAVALLALLAIPAAGDELLPADRTVEEVIDHYIELKLQAAGVSPAPSADDANLLRRTMLDVVGRPPTVAEARAFVTDAGEGKRVALVDRLMASPAFIRQQVAEFDALLMRDTKASLRDYLTKAFGENRSWDRMFRDMIVGESDDPQQKGAIAFVRARAKDQDRLATDTSVLFFGVNVSCAKCHDHPLVDDWKQEHYYGMKSFFSRTFDVGEFVGEKDYGIVKYQTALGASHDARLMFLTGEVLSEPDAKEPDDNAKKEEKKQLEELKKKKEPPPSPTYSRRARLVEVALQPQSEPWFARAIVNHLFQRFFGRGLVMPVDQMHSGNTPSHPELLAWLARDMQSHNYDLKRMIRGMVLSRAYARSSRWESASPRPADDLFAAAIVRPLTPWQYGTSLKLAATNPDTLSGKLPAEQLEQRIQPLEAAGRSLAEKVEYPADGFQVSVDEALFLSNSEKAMQELLQGGDDSLLAKLTQFSDRREAIETAVWNVLGRGPAEEELQALDEFLARRHDNLPAAYKQMIWALLTSSECRFNY